MTKKMLKIQENAWRRALENQVCIYSGKETALKEGSLFPNKGKEDVRDKRVPLHACVCVECRFIALGSRNSRGEREIGKERRGEKESRLMYCAKLKHSIAASRRGERKMEKRLT